MKPSVLDVQHALMILAIETLSQATQENEEQARKYAMMILQLDPEEVLSELSK